ncbi:hypothetical protein GJAV_G00101350 [Gymnothorax javanicus]|nr:hypothetical protein GJAV_G00101350 [Gymnothorax javanicus]
MELLWMTEGEFDSLLGMVGPLITKRDTNMRRAVSPRDRLSLTLQFLATGESFKSVGFQCRLGASTVSQIVMETCAALYQVMEKHFLTTPSTEAEWRKIARDFELKQQLPHCVGALDGIRIHVQAPGKSSRPYHNSKSGSSVIITAAVDANYRFIHANVGTHAGLFAHSDLCEKMDQGLLNFPPPEPLPNSNIVMPYMFVGDDAYPLRPDLMTPYPHRQMDHRQSVLNCHLLRARRVAENAFGILSNRLRVLRTTVCLEPQKVVKIAMAALCIHNFLCERRSEAYAPPDFADWENPDHSIVEGAWKREGLGALQPVEHRKEFNATAEAEQQRNLLCDYFLSSAGAVSWQEQEQV